MKYGQLFAGILGCALAACGGAKTKPDAATAPEGIWVTKLNGAKQCGTNEGKVLDPKSAANLLVSRGVKVLEAKSAHDGQMRPMMCGAPTGDLVELRIAPEGLAAAEKAGFKRQRLGDALPPPPRDEVKD